MRSIFKLSSFSWFWVILGFALGIRLFWWFMLRHQYGHDAILYLLISENVTTGEWERLPHLWTSPLLPLCIGLLSWITGDVLQTGRIFCLLLNVLAVGLAMLIIRKGIPQRPALAWLTGVALAVNHVWAGISPFTLTENLFYPLLLGLFLLFLFLFEKPNWIYGLGFGTLWGLAYLTREVGIYCGCIIFIVLLTAKIKSINAIKENIINIIKVSIPILSVLFVIVGLWIYCFYMVFGIVSLSEKPRFVMAMMQSLEKKEHPLKYHQGTVGVTKLRPYEVMEYTRAPLPNDERYPSSIKSWHVLLLWKQLFRGIPKNLKYSIWEVKLVILPSLVGLGLIFLTEYFNPSKAMAWATAASFLVLGLHEILLVRESRHIAWFFPWLYLGLAACFLWIWDHLRSKTSKKALKILLPLSIPLFVFLLIYPDYLKEVPKKWKMRNVPHLYQLASDYILKTHGPGAVISAYHFEMVYRCRGLLIGQPEGTPAELVEWLYLGGADYLFFTNKYPRTEAQPFFWGDPKLIRQRYPELELVAEFQSANPVYPRRGRLFRFHPDPLKMAKYKEQYPWAGTRPRPYGSKLCPASSQ